MNWRIIAGVFWLHWKSFRREKTLFILMMKLLTLLWILLGFLSVQETTNGAEVAVALVRCVVESSQFMDLVAGFAVDSSPLSCSQTSTQTDPWWRAELLNEHLLTTVSITTDSGIYYSRLNGAVIRVGSVADDIYSNPVCATVPTIPQGGTANFSCGLMEGRYVIIHIPGVQKILTLCDVKIYGYQEENAALWRSANLSTQYEDWTPRYAVDSLQETCAQSLLQTDPWWTVDLLNRYQVHLVSITNQDDPVQYSSINGAEIRVGNSSDVYGNPVCAVVSTIAAGATATFPCGGMEGRYVIVHLPGAGQVLTVCEVEVYGSLLGNLASRGSAVQSSTFQGWWAEKAIDGSRGLLQPDMWCSSTLAQTDPWWRLDLGDFYQVTRVVVTNRNDCCADALDGVEIRVGDSLENNSNHNPICAVVPAIPAGDSYNYSCDWSTGRYVNLVIPGDMRTLTLCEVEVFGIGPVLENSLVKMQFESRVDLTSVTIRADLLRKLESALAETGLTNVTLSWSKPPEPLRIH